jgi:hypothetical protein
MFNSRNNSSDYNGIIFEFQNKLPLFLSLRVLPHFFENSANGTDRVKAILPKTTSLCEIEGDSASVPIGLLNIHSFCDVSKSK